MSTGTLFKARRNALGISIEQAADRIGCGYNTYWRWENDYNVPRDWEHRQKICSVLMIAPADLDRILKEQCVKESDQTAESVAEKSKKKKEKKMDAEKKTVEDGKVSIQISIECLKKIQPMAMDEAKDAIDRDDPEAIHAWVDLLEEIRNALR